MEHLQPVIIYEDDYILVFSKPAGMIVNNADTSRDVFTLQDFIENTYPSLHDKGESDFSKRAGIVHRLDKETSGVIIVAKNEECFLNLQKQFKNRTIEKKYIALVHGKISEEGSINAPIGRLPWNRMRFGIIPKGRESFTEFKVKKYYSFNNKEILSLVEVYPKTGRTHQIRVHFQYAGFPIFSDELYSGRKTYSIDKKYLRRHFLHASEITFDHPHSNKRVEFSTPLTDDLNQFLQRLDTVKP